MKWVKRIVVVVLVLVLSGLYLFTVTSQKAKYPALSRVQHPSIGKFHPFVPSSVMLQDLQRGRSRPYFGKQFAVPGQLGLVHFWASWCESCQEELPTLAQFARKFPQISVYMVSLDEVQERADIFVKRQDIRSPNLHYLRDSQGDLAGLWGTTQLPETYFLTSQGIVFEKLSGPQLWLAPDMVRYFSQLLQELQRML